VLGARGEGRAHGAIGEARRDGAVVGGVGGGGGGEWAAWARAIVAWAIVAWAIVARAIVARAIVVAAAACGARWWGRLVDGLGVELVELADEVAGFGELGEIDFAAADEVEDELA